MRGSRVFPRCCISNPPAPPHPILVLSGPPKKPRSAPPGKNSGPENPSRRRKKSPREIMACFRLGPSVLVVARPLALVAPIVLTNRQNKARPVPPSQAEEEETLHCRTNCYKWAAIRFQLSYAIVLKNALTSFV